jgi:hypothetical protein
MNGGSLHLDGKEIVNEGLKDRRGLKKVQGSAEPAAGRRKIELICFHTGQEPSLSFEMEGPRFTRQPIPSSMLSVFNELILAFEPVSVKDIVGSYEPLERGCNYPGLGVVLKPVPAYT